MIDSVKTTSAKLVSERQECAMRREVGAADAILFQHLLFGGEVLEHRAAADVQYSAGHALNGAFTKDEFRREDYFDIRAKCHHLRVVVEAEEAC